jgi:hypothetical protein
MSTLHLRLHCHTIRIHASMDYELIAYFVADQTLSQRNAEAHPWSYLDIVATLIQYAALPVSPTLVCGLIVHPPTVRIVGRRALLRQRISSQLDWSGNCASAAIV